MKKGVEYGLKVQTRPLATKYKDVINIILDIVGFFNFYSFKEVLGKQNNQSFFFKNQLIQLLWNVVLK